MFGLGVGELVLILLLLVFLFGAKKIPLIARGLGGAIRNFKGALKEDTPEIESGDEPKLPPGDGEP
ncbi:MAG: twin-arginine translocase TatA/TatE family subunit [Longimicrobiales bacterium]